MINGIPVRIKTTDDKGVQSVETFYFATFRKCPELAKYPKEMTKAEKDIKVLRRKLEIAEETLANSADEVKCDIAGQQIERLNDEMNAVNDRLLDSFRAFVETGLKAAGYDDASVERYAAHVDIDRFPELFAKARIGAGACDFF